MYQNRTFEAPKCMTMIRSVGFRFTIDFGFVYVLEWPSQEPSPYLEQAPPMHFRHVAYKSNSYYIEGCGE